jgi:hypothetical protein
MLRATFAAFGLCAASALAHADELFVPEQHASIAAALLAAEPGDTILVGPGTYAESELDFAGKDVVLSSTAGPEATVIDGGGRGPIVRFTSGESANCVLAGFTLRNAIAAPGAALLCVRSSPTLFGNVFEQNACADAPLSGALYFESSASYMNGNTVRGTSAATAALCAIGSELVLEVNTLEDNATRGFYGASSEALILFNTIRNNRASLGAGLMFDFSGPQLFGNTITDNGSLGGDGPITSFGGGIYCGPGSAPLLIGNEIARNRAQRGGGIAVAGQAAPTIRDGQLSDNVASIDGGGLHAAAGAQVLLERNLVEGNRAAQRGGGAWWGAGSGIARLNTWRGNEARLEGGALRTDLGVQLDFEGNLVVENSARFGAGLFLAFGGQVQVRLSTIADNSALLPAEPLSGPGIYNEGQVVVSSSILWGNGAPAPLASFGPLGVEHSLVQGGAPGVGVLDEDPLFGADYALQADSPCVDRGAPGLQVFGPDIGSTPRVLDGDLANGKRVDMGAFEHTPTKLELSGEAVPGTTVELALSGTPGMSGIIFAGFASGEIPLGELGSLLFSPSATVLVLSGWKPLPFTSSVAIPPGFPAQSRVYVQALGVDFAAGAGAASKLHVLLF